MNSVTILVTKVRAYQDRVELHNSLGSAQLNYRTHPDMCIQKWVMHGQNLDTVEDGTQRVWLEVASPTEKLVRFQIVNQQVTFLPLFSKRPQEEHPGYCHRVI
jgi:hypothetical protein